MDGPKGDFFRANLRHRTPEEQTLEEQSKAADRIADQIIDASGVDPVSPKQEDEEAEAWSRVEAKNIDEVRSVILDEKFAERPSAEQHAYALRWNNLRSRE